MRITDFDPDEPMCSSGKRGWRTEEIARENLAQAQRYRANPSEGSPRRPGVVEKDVVHCKACGWWHFMSGKAVVNAQGKRRGGRGKTRR